MYSVFSNGGLSTTTSWRVNSNNGCVLGESVRSWWSTEVKHLNLKTHVWVHMLNPHMHIDDWGNLKIRLINKQLNETNASTLVVCYHRYSVFYRVMAGGVRPATQVSSALFPTIIASEYTIVSLQFQWEKKVKLQCWILAQICLLPVYMLWIVQSLKWAVKILLYGIWTIVCSGSLFLGNT